MGENPRLVAMLTIGGVLLALILGTILAFTFGEAISLNLERRSTETVSTADTEESAAATGDTGAAAAETTASQEGVDQKDTATAETTASETESVAQTGAVAMIQSTAPSHAVAAFNRGGCAGCHVIPGIPGANGQVGPDLSNIGVNGATRIDGYTAAEYIHESIVEPGAFIAPECPNGACPPGVMLQSFAQTLNDDDLDSIVGYLATLGTGEEMVAGEADAAPVALDLSLPPESVLEPFAVLAKDPASAEQIALGKYLFFDQRLSGNNSLSCASCHQPDKTFTDGQAMSRGYPSTNYFRNTPSVYNSVFADYLYWDGRMDAGDMPTMVRDHLTEAHFMSMDGRLMFERLKQVPQYNDAFVEVMGGDPSFGKVLNAVTAYVQSLNSPPSAYDAYVAGDESALSDDAKAGLALFEGKAQCGTCHSGALLSDEGFHNTGIGTDPALFTDPERHVTFRRFFRTLGMPNYRNLNEDLGLYALTLEDEDRASFQTPGLREVANTAPYMHDGSLATLEEVVQFYNVGGGEAQNADLEPLDLSDEEIAQLVAFLESLSSDLPAVEPPALPDYGLVQLGDQPLPDTTSTVSAPATDAATAAPEEAAAVAEEPAVAEPAAEEPATETATAADAAAAELEPVPVTDELIAVFTKGTCIACHMIAGVPGAIGQIGPDLSNIGVDAATRVEGQSAVDYIHESIVDPLAFIAPECPTGACAAGAMPPGLNALLTEDELTLVVNYLAGLKGDE